jgi:multiple sugar transport system permease protein
MITMNAQPLNAGRKRPEKAVAFWLLCAPMLAGMILFTIVPAVWGLVLSLSDSHGTLEVHRLVGLQNYRRILSDPDFLYSLLTISVFALLVVPVTYACSLGLALLVNRAKWGRGWFRTILFLPTSVSYVVASLVWKTSLFSGMPYGLANLALGHLGVAPILWIGTASPPWHWLVLVTVRLWLQVGFYVVIFLAALQEIPSALYEAAHIDSAGAWPRFWHITLPQLRNTSTAVILLSLIAAFQAFDEFYNILGGGAGASLGNENLAVTPLMHLYNVALADSQYGRGSAGAFILTLLLLLATGLQWKFIGFGGAED